jgi:hypothetical protein
MSATYNWAYKPGVTNKYGLTVPASADNVRPTNWAYVALSGNDSTGNGSRQLPFRTINKAATTVGNVVAGSGVYRETITTQLSILVGDGEVVIDPTLINLGAFANSTGNFYNLKVQGAAYLGIAGNPFILNDCFFDGVTPGERTQYNYNGNTLTNSIFARTSINFSSDNYLTRTSLTFYRCNIAIGNNYSAVNAFNNCIFVECNILFTALVTSIDYSLFWNCNFFFGSGSGYSGTTVPQVFYPSIPPQTGWFQTNDINTFRTQFIAKFGSPAVTPLAHCIMADPKFNNAAIGDFTLAMDSPARNLSFNGTYVGARSIAFALKARATESAGDFDFSSITNLTVADNSITFTNPASDAQVDTKVIGNLITRELARIPVYGFSADRNGQYIDSMADLAGSTLAAGGTLGVPVPYLVETAAITYNGAVYTPGQRFTTVTGVTTFTTVAGGVVREILEAPQRHTLMARFGDGGGPIAAGAALVAGNWYSVLAGSVTQAGVTYNAPAIFKALTTQAFTGNGTVEIAMSSEAYQQYEPYLKPTSNNVGDARTGAIVRGNGDPDYVRGGLGVKEFPINTKYMQFRYYLKANNLKP